MKNPLESLFGRKEKNTEKATKGHEKAETADVGFFKMCGPRIAETFKKIVNVKNITEIQ